MNVVHIVSSSSTVQNVAIMGVTNSGSPSTTAIDDELTAQGAAATTKLTDKTVALYAIGQKTAIGSSNARPRFTTSPSVPNWSVGKSSVAGISCSENGSLYSNIDGTANSGGIGAGNTWFVCQHGAWLDIF